MVNVDVAEQLVEKDDMALGALASASVTQTTTVTE